MTNLLATILITVVTNSWHPKMPVSENYYFLSPTNNIVNCGDGTYSWPTWPLFQTQDDPDTLITEVREIESLLFSYKGNDYRVETGNRLLSTVTKRRKVKQTEEWVEEPSKGIPWNGGDGTPLYYHRGSITNVTDYYSVTNLTTESTVATNVISKAKYRITECWAGKDCPFCSTMTNDPPDSPSSYPIISMIVTNEALTIATNITGTCTIEWKKLTNDLPDSPSALPLVVLEGDVDTVPEDGK